MYEPDDAYDGAYSAPAEAIVAPHNTQAERSVIGSMLISAEAIADVMGKVRANDFYEPRHAILFDAIFTLYSHGEGVDVVTVGEQLAKTGQLGKIKGHSYLHELSREVPSPASAEFYAEIVAEKALLRRLAGAGSTINDMGMRGEGEALDLVNEAQALIFQVNSEEGGQDYIHISQALERAVKEVEHANQNPEDSGGVPTGFKELDEMTNGFTEGQMIIIAARPAMGKSTLALDIARNAAVGARIPTVFFSLEMGASEIAMRLISAEGTIALQSLRKGTLDQRQFATIGSVQSRLEGVPLYIDDSPNTNLAEIRAKCRRLKQQNGLGLVVIDYLQLLRSGKKVENRQQEVSEFSRALKLLAKELQLPVVALSQLNRNPEQRAEKRPLISDLRESGSLEQDADMVILLHRELGQTENTDSLGQAEFIVAKQRNGPTGSVNVSFQGQYSRFQDMPQGISEF